MRIMNELEVFFIVLIFVIVVFAIEIHAFIDLTRMDKEGKLN